MNTLAQIAPLKRHEASVHEGKKPFKCNICDVEFAQKSKLNIHIISVHEKNIIGEASFAKCRIPILNGI